MKVGFTGNQKGMTLGQYLEVETIIKQLEPEEVHHGDCVGADTHFHKLIQRLEIPKEIKAPIDIVIHPCNIEEKRAFNERAKLVHEPKDPLVRNRDIVDQTDVLIACPKKMEPQLRSGTWATIRYAQKMKKPVHIVWPNGQQGAA